MGLILEAAAKLIPNVVTFLLFLLGTAIVKSYDRSREHREALIQLQFTLNHQLDSTHLNRAACRASIKDLTSGHVAGDMPIKHTPMAYESIYAIRNAELVNEFLLLNGRLRRLDADIENLTTAYENIADRYMDEKINQQKYVLQCAPIVRGLNKMDRSFESFGTEVRDFLALLYVHIHHRQSHTLRFVGWIAKDLMFRHPTVTPELIAARRTQIDREVEETKAKSLARIAKLSSEEAPPEN